MPAFFAEALISFSREKDALPKGVISSPRAYTLPDNIGSFAVRAEMQRCQIHKRRNVKEHLPESAQGDTDRRIRNAYAMTEYAAAKAELGKIFRQLERVNPSAACEGTHNQAGSTAFHTPISISHNQT